MKDFFVPCTPKKQAEVVKLLQELGYKQWEGADAMIWHTGLNGIQTTKEGDYLVSYQCIRDTIVTLDELRQMVFEKSCATAFPEANVPLEWIKQPASTTTENPYQVIKELGFNEEQGHDPVHEREYGYPYKVFYLNLTKRISLDWNQVTRKARILRCDKDGNIKNEAKVTSENRLRDIVSFFKEDNQ